MNLNESIITDIQSIINNSRDQAVRAVDQERVLMYWQIGKRIFEEEQGGEERAEYGSQLLKFLSEKLQPKFGTGFSARNLAWFRQFYKSFPIVSALRTQLSWSHYKSLLSLNSDDKVSFYREETIKNNWTARQMDRQISSNLYERLLLSTDKDSVLSVARNEKPPTSAKDIIKVGIPLKLTMYSGAMLQCVPPIFDQGV
ncbi:DUF1016 N-terminal domain-containing protein, partial [Mucilaginibacter sp. RCC_168]|uniref:DUF1016 N-terminal domain-containing protein n=1 Tax=Mucilaginibacter sp. RCC_168 TaxID=3239221 RepID=UPI00352384E6